jgi:hypothetical protein
MYIIYAPVIIPMCLQITKEERTHLWHNRYGHLSVNGLKLLTHKNMVKGFPELGNIAGKCSDCIVAKHKSDYSPKQARWRATE